MANAETIRCSWSYLKWKFIEIVNLSQNKPEKILLKNAVNFEYSTTRSNEEKFKQVLWVSNLKTWFFRSTCDN